MLDSLSTDIEGMDVPVLNDLFATTYPPRWVVFELPRSSESDLLSANGLSRLAEVHQPVARTSVNLIIELNKT